MKREKKVRAASDQSPLGVVEDILARQASAWRALALKFSACRVPSTIPSQALLDPYQLGALLTDADILFEHLGAQDRHAYAQFKTWLETERGKVSGEFELRLRGFCEIEGISVEGRFPTYTLAGFLLVEASPVNGWCDINGKRYRTLLFDALAPKILAEIKEDRDRAFDPRAFIEELHRAVLRVKALESAAESSLLPIMLVFRELLFVKQPPQFFRNPNKKNLHEYNVALFARDLGRVLSEGPITTLAGSRLDLGPSSSPNDGIPLHQDGAVRIVGRIGFREGAEK